MVGDLLFVFIVAVPYTLIVYVRGYRDGTQDKARTNGR